MHSTLELMRHHLDAMPLDQRKQIELWAEVFRTVVNADPETRDARVLALSLVGAELAEEE